MIIFLLHLALRLLCMSSLGKMWKSDDPGYEMASCGSIFAQVDAGGTSKPLDRLQTHPDAKHEKYI